MKSMKTKVVEKSFSGLESRSEQVCNFGKGVLEEREGKKGDLLMSSAPQLLFPFSDSGTAQPSSAVSLLGHFQFPAGTYEYKVTALRECPMPSHLELCDTPERAATYWRRNVSRSPYFNPDCECFVVLLLNTRKKIKGHYLVSIGTMDTILIHPREVFRLAVITSSAAIVLMHNHPSGDPSPSEADIRVTRDLIRAGQLLKIEVLDHVVMGNPNHSSLRELGYFYS
jgi:DNA repair protein RadC